MVPHKIELPKFPSIAQLGSWKSYLRNAMVEATGCKAEKELLKWLSEAEQDNATVDDLAHSGPLFPILDLKLAAALKRILGGGLACRVQSHNGTSIPIPTWA